MIPVPVMRDKTVSREKTIEYMSLGDALTRPFATRAVMMAYSLPSLPRRLVREEIDTYAGVPMRLLIVDVDDQVAHAEHRRSTSSWRIAERSKIAKMLTGHPGGVFYFTPAGWRAIYVLAKPFIINSALDEERWRASYLAVVRELRETYAIAADPSGSRWNQCFDVPRATRDSGHPERPETIGDPHAIGTWDLQMVEAKVTPKRGTVCGDAEDTLLGREFMRRGMAGKVTRGKLAVVCPWTSNHTTGRDLDGSTVIMPPTTERRHGWFHCSHAHCGAFTQGDVSRALGIVTESTGVTRLRADLDAEAPADSQRVALGAVEETLTRGIGVLAGPRRLTVIRVTLGAGKTRAVVRSAVASRRRWVIGVPRHDLVREVAERFNELGVRVRRLRGVLRTIQDKPVCKQPDRAAALQAVGASVPTTLCKTCPHAPGCPARKRDQPERVTIAPHQLAESAMDSDEGSEVPLLVFDETPSLLEEMPLTRADLATALHMLDGDLLDREFGAELRPFVLALAGAADDSERSSVALDGRNLGAQPTDAEPQPVEQVPRFRVDPNALSHQPDAIPVGRWREFVETFRIFRAILAARELHRIAWRADGLAVHALTPEALLLRSGGAIVVDATPPLAMLRALVAGTSVDLAWLSLSVADGAPIQRSVLYSSGATRSKLAPGKAVRWDAVAPLLARTLASLRDVDGRVLLVTFKAIADGLRAGVLAHVLGERVDVAHFGAVRGSDQWRNHDALATLGDPWPDVGVAREQALAMGLDPEPYLREVARAELAQAHGRLRDPSRSRAAKHVHVGAIAPLGWTTANTHVEARPAGRPRTNRLPMVEQLRRCVGEHGGQRAAAKALGISRRALRDYLGGRAVPAEVASKISCRDYAPILDATEGVDQRGRVIPAETVSTRVTRPALSKARVEFDVDDARYAYRERYAIALDGGATEPRARHLALAELPVFRFAAWAGAFDFEPRRRPCEDAAAC